MRQTVPPFQNLLSITSLVFVDFRRGPLQAAKADCLRFDSTETRDEQMRRAVSKLSRAALGVLLSCLYSVPAVATKFECTTTESYQWKDGQFKPSEFNKNTLVYFDDQTIPIVVGMRHNKNDVRSIYMHSAAQIDIPFERGNLVVSNAPTPIKTIHGDEVPPGKFILNITARRIDKDLRFQPIEPRFFLYQNNAVNVGDCVLSE